MATMVLTTVGGAIGGPVGAALGGLIGRAVDGAPTRQGPRLSDLRVQTSSYGTAIPKLFGTVRVAGTVIWATDLRETSGSSGGKATGRTTTYSYSASFAVALSGRPIRGVRRIWAEGKLLRGAAGDWKTRTGFRLYVGDEGQAPDPLIASIVGIGAAPAHRGIAYAVFEDMALADFGNRIPSLTFEVEADEGTVSVGAVVEGLGGGAIRAGDAGPILRGYAASGDSVGDAVDALVGPVGGWYAAEGAGVVLRQGPGPARVVTDGGATGDAPEWRRPPAQPASVAIAYHDIDRDHQIGVQQVLTPGAGGRVARIELPAAMTGADAAGIAGAAAARLALSGVVRTVTLDWDALGIGAGDRIAMAGEPGLWRARRVRIEGAAVVVELVPIAAATLPPPVATGVAQLAADEVAGATLLRLVELPDGDGGVQGTPTIAAVAAGTGPGWRRATLLYGDDAGGWHEAGGTAAAGTIGRVDGGVAVGPSTIEDRATRIEVVLPYDGMTLHDADDAALDSGGNAALIGDEIVQFGRAERLSPTRWRLSRLWRGRRGTEWAIAAHGEGDGFVLLDPATLRRVDAPAAVGVAWSAMAVGIAGDDVATATILPDGRGIVPPAPVHLTIGREGDMLVLAWVRRGRGGWAWRDAVEIPLGEEREAYRVTRIGADGVAVTNEVAEPALRIAIPASPTRIEVRQIGTHGPSRPATILYLPETFA